MADNPITVPLPQDLPQNWTYGQTIGPQGTDVGLTQQHGYNYLMQQVNAAQQAAQELGEAFSGLPTLGSDGKIPEDQLPPMNYDPVGSAETVQENLNAHVEDKENPHGVTYQQVGAAAESHIHDASAVVSGTFAAARIPGLDAGKITSGILPVARGGTGVSSLDELVKALGAVKVTAGSYTGNGQYGKETPNSLSFPFPPKFLMIAEPQGYSVIVINNSQYALYGGVGARYLFATWSGNSVSWYSPDGERDQMNSSGKTYTYYAFG